ncbi:MAG: type II toxin-antitoxin system VapC family toxin [Vicinamibacteria bacterium]
MKCLLDTSVYIDASRSAQAKARFEATFFPLVPLTFLSAVVAYELYVNARDRRTRRLVAEWVAPMERTGRLVSPTFSDWVDAADVVASIEERDRTFRSKLPALLNDILIALCARRIGATVFTYNRQDFQLIHRHRDFSLRVMASPAS